MSYNLKSFKTKLWSAKITVKSEALPFFQEAMGEGALAVTTLSPPRQAKAEIEALFDFEPDQSALTAQLSIVSLLNHIEVPKIHVRSIPQCDWLKKVSEDFPPLPIARWTIHGAQHRKHVPNRRLALQIGATNAFGTGEHPTTRGCLLLLDWLLKSHAFKPRRMLDMGCGSGILAMAFAKASQGKAIGIDLDPDSIVIAKNNANQNGLGTLIKVSTARGYRSKLVHQNAPYDLIMSNIFARPLASLAYDLKKHLRPGGNVILAGLLNHQVNQVLAAHRLQKLSLVKRLVIGEWSILALKHRKRA